MAANYYLERTEEGKATQFIKFKDHIEDYAEALGFPKVNNLLNPDLQQQAKDADYYRWVVDQVTAGRDYAKAITAWRDALREGYLPATPAVPLPPAHEPPVAVPTGIVGRFAAIVRTCKGSKNYTPALGEILGIEGAGAGYVDINAAQPDLTGARVEGDKVRVPWIKSLFDALYVEVDRGDGKGFVFLATDTRPDYYDTAPFPPGGAVWKYRAIYLLADEKVGQWSAVVTVRV